jgi:hypothetical protein
MTRIDLLMCVCRHAVVRNPAPTTVQAAMARRSTLTDLPQPKTYVLDKNNPVQEPDMVKFGEFLASEAIVVRQDMLSPLLSPLFS